MPTLKYLGFAFWIAWNLIAFSGSVWFVETDSSFKISNLFVAHLSICFVVLVGFSILQEHLSKFVLKDTFAMTGGCVASIGCVFIIIARPGMLASPYPFFFGCVLTGLGTTLLFVRSAPIYATQNPKSSFIRLCESMIFASAVYFITKSIPDPIDKIVFICIPLFSALLLNTETPTGESHSILSKKDLPKTGIRNFLIAVFVFSFSVQILRTALIAVPPSQGIKSYDEMLLILLFTCMVFLFWAVSWARPFSLALIYLPATLVIVALLIIIPLFSFDPVFGGALTGSSTYGFNILVWSMLSYLAFRSKSNAITIFCSGNALLSAGSVAGTVVSTLLLQSQLQTSLFKGLCALLVLVALATSVLVFPESKLSTLIPSYNVALAQQHRKATPWKDACERIGKKYSLSPREQEVLFEISRGRSTQQVSEQLVISPYTTRAHIRHIYRKLDVHSRDELFQVISKEKDHPGQRSMQQ